MKICTKCKISKKLTSFGIRKDIKCGRTSRCKKCLGLYAKSHYLNNKNYYIDKAKEHKEKYRQKIRELKDKPCTDCKVKYPYYVMDFDHKKDKKFTIARAWCRSWKKSLDEIKKCDLVCANCHRIRTQKRIK